MARKLYSKHRGNFVGFFPPPGGWQAGRKGIQRILCSVEEIQHLSEFDQAVHLADLYARKEREITNESFQKDQERKKKKQRNHLPVSNIVKLWIAERSVNCSPKTIKMYKRSLALYVKACADHEIRDYDNDKYLKYLKYLRENSTYRGRPLAETTVHTHVRHLKNFLLFCKDESMFESFKRLKMPHLPKKDMRTLSLGQLDKLKQHILDELKKSEENMDLKRIMDMKNMLRAFMMATQMIGRIGAIWSLKLEFIDLNERLIYIRDNPELNWKNKWKKHPDKPMTDELYDFLLNDLSDRSEDEKYYLDKGNGEPWFKDQGAVSSFASRLFRQINLPNVKPFHWGMRATIITELLLNGVDKYAVQQLADHDDIKTTMLYMNSRKVQQKNAVDGISMLMKKTEFED